MEKSFLTKYSCSVKKGSRIPQICLAETTMYLYKTILKKEIKELCDHTTGHFCINGVFEVSKSG
jgi:hypothetical protein